MDAKRGFVPEDEKNFAPEAIERMKTAARHITYLLNEGYDLKQATVFVGNHFLLSERQRLAIMRSTASQEQISERKKKEIPLGELAGREVWIDGFNIIISLEVMLCDSLLFKCMDGTIRDLAALRGTYRLIPETSQAIEIMFDVLREAGASRINILLDQPVSNSGRLKSRIADIAEEKNLSAPSRIADSAEGKNISAPADLNISILRDVDRELYKKECVITSDSIILDHCMSWINLTAECMKRSGKQGIKVWEA